MRVQTTDVLGIGIASLTWAGAIDVMRQWARERSSRSVYLCNAHSLATARTDAELFQALSAADMAAPDGQSVATLMRLLGVRGQVRISGPDLMWRFCSTDTGEISMYLYGATPETLALLRVRLTAVFPHIRIAGAYSPPFRQLTEVEQEQIVRDINDSGAGIVWVGLGCPKQEKWIHAQRGRINAVMVGVGAAFDYHAGSLKRAPAWMQRTGMEWFYRLLVEPRRLWRRYLVTNSIFLYAGLMQLARKRL